MLCQVRIASHKVMMKGILAAAPLCALTWLAVAQGGRPGVIGADDRVAVAERGAPWDAVGQVNIGGYRRSGRCTGTLVAPDLVITAAHCLVDRHTGTVHPPRHIHFLASVGGAGVARHAAARCVRFLTGYTFVPTRSGGERLPLSALDRDAAAIVLEAPLGIAPAPVATAAGFEPGTALVHAAYPADRRFRLTAHVGCRLLSPEGPGPLWLTDCDTHPASSGGPVFATQDGMLVLAAVMVGVGTAVNLALPASAWRELLDGGRCP